MAGWCCCAHWEGWENWDAEDYEVARESLKDQVLRLRNHPCLMDWLNGSDFPPPPDVERSYIEVLERFRWPNPYQSSASEEPTPVSGETGLKMTGPYEYVPPVYWYADTGMGGAFGFNTETGPGIAVPPVEGLIRMLPQGHLWPIDKFWDFHAGGGLFLLTRTKIFTHALESRYGAATGLEDYVMKSNAMNYETQRAMFEAYRRNKYTSTGVIQWMLNDAWPSLIWHLYDYDLRPLAGYFGTKKACEPLHIQYAYDDGSVVVVNALYQDFPGMRATAQVFNLDMTEKFTRESSVDVPADSSSKVFNLPRIRGLTSTYFLKLTLEDSAGNPVTSNFYWLSTRPDILAWPLAMWFFTPTLIFADFTLLQSLPPVELNVSAAVEERGGEGRIHVTVENAKQNLAFLVHLRVLKGLGGEELLPIRWDDNYFSLMPGELREISAVYRIQDLEGAEPRVQARGWNVNPLRGVPAL